jgi:hypothetical protein
VTGRERMEDHIDQALEALGGEDTEFYLDGCGGAGVEHAVRLTCRYQGCEWGIFVGEMELWEFVTDAREHWEAEHASTIAGGAP